MKSFLVLVALVLQGCTLTITLTPDQKPQIQAEAIPEPYEYSLTYNTVAAAKHGWEVYGTAPDGRSMVKRLRTR